MVEREPVPSQWLPWRTEKGGVAWGAFWPQEGASRPSWSDYCVADLEGCVEANTAIHFIEITPSRAVVASRCIE